VAELIAQGFTNRGIAEELFLSERTVLRHASKRLKKLELAPERSPPPGQPNEGCSRLIQIGLLSPERL
jgi:hypothetical protein